MSLKSHRLLRRSFALLLLSTSYFRIGVGPTYCLWGHSQRGLDRYIFHDAPSTSQPSPCQLRAACFVFGVV
ncbi:hypothetical protein F5Y13DRAFT_167105 [Hypoxylon sp. FL1857]|nr:hypothetical protein F5Y13DRAFT_167105 [Hypoxylon sp. FL1857]